MSANDINKNIEDINKNVDKLLKKAAGLEHLFNEQLKILKKMGVVFDKLGIIIDSFADQLSANIDGKEQEEREDNNGQG